GTFKNVVENIYGRKVEAGQRPPDQKGVVPQKGRWQVEISFAWLNNFRRLAKDFKKTTASTENFIQVAAISTILARLA
ncbi:MAG: transposase, partial [Bacteroidota bacterium]